MSNEELTSWKSIDQAEWRTTIHDWDTNEQLGEAYNSQGRWYAWLGKPSFGRVIHSTPDRTDAVVAVMTALNVCHGLFE